MNESKYYKRVCTMNVGGKVLKSTEGMTLEFETDFSLDLVCTQTKAKIYNPSPETVASCRAETDVNGNITQLKRITIDAGYESFHGTCIVGEISKFELKKGQDDVLEISVGEKTWLWRNAVVNYSRRGYITAKRVIEEIFKELGVVAAKIELGENKAYDNGIAFLGKTLQGAMMEIAADTKSTFIFRDGLAYFLSEPAGVGTAIVLAPETGLLEAGETDYGYKIKMLFNYQCGSGTLLILNHGGNSIKLKIRKGKHKFSTAGTATTEAEAIRIW